MFELKNAEPVHVIHWESIANDCYYGKCDWCNALFLHYNYKMRWQNNLVQNPWFMQFQHDIRHSLFPQAVLAHIWNRNNTMKLKTPTCDIQDTLKQDMSERPLNYIQLITFQVKR